MATPAPRVPIDLYLLVIAENSNMLVLKNNDIPMIPRTDPNHIKFPLDNTEISNKLKNYLSRPDPTTGLPTGLSHINFDFSRFVICSSDPSTTPLPTPIPTPRPTPAPATVASTFVAIICVDESEKALIKTDPNFVFRKTYEDDPTSPTGRRAATGLTASAQAATFFTAFSYLTSRNTSTLDNCINSAPKPTSSSTTASTASTTTPTTTWIFYRPIYPNPLFFPNSYNSYVSPVGYQSPRYSPSSSPRLYPRPSSERMVAPRVPRSPRSSPRMGGYKEKYIKYKAKYMKLKSELSNLNI
jgi:hypothetical protein